MASRRCERQACNCIKHRSYETLALALTSVSEGVILYLIFSVELQFKKCNKVDRPATGSKWSLVKGQRYGDWVAVAGSCHLESQCVNSSK